MKRKTIQFCTASGSNDFDATAAIKTLRETATGMQTALAGLEDILDEPLKSKFSEVKKQINTMLAGLPATDQVPAALASNDVLSRLLSVLSTAQMMISSLDETAKSARTQLASTRASIPTEIETAIAGKITSGELIPKDKHTKAIEDATAAASTSAKATAATELKRISERRNILTTASIPVPADEFLAVEDKDFEAKKVIAAKRAEDLKVFKLEPARVLALAWNTDESAYQDSIALMKKAFEAAGKGAVGANGFANRTASEATAAGSKPFLC